MGCNIELKAKGMIHFKHVVFYKNLNIVCVFIFLTFVDKILKMKSLFNFGIIVLCFVFSSHAQVENEVLFTIGEEQFSVESFVDSYTKNLDLTTSSGEALEDYLELYINFQLKLKSAYQQGLDTLDTFQTEYQNYYKQIADNYISNGEVTEAMVRETYDRTITEVKASHILLRVPQNETDTIEAYNKALMIKQKAENGEDFEALAKTYSDDPSAKQNAGDMSWFNRFKMVYEFEDAVYKMDVGEISQPVRSQFGYHVIKKTGERPSKGKLSTAHIMLINGDSLQQPEVQIQKIYKKLEAGEDFHDLAKQYSQDRSTAKNGGYLSPFSLGDINSNIFESKVYEIENEGDYTKPFQTKFGWHIVKLIKTEPIKDYDELKADIKQQLKASSRSKLLVSKIKEDLEKRYTLEINPDAKLYFINALDSTYSTGKWKFEPQDKSSDDYVLRVENQNVDYKTFGKYLEKQYRMLSQRSNFTSMIEDAIDELSYSELLSYHKAQLPEIDDEFRKKINEYKHGILIFDFMKANVWDPVSEDTLSQNAYYKANQDNFIKEAQVKGQLYTSKFKASLKDLKTRLDNQLTQDSLVLPDDVILEEVSVSKTSPKLPKRFKFKEGMSRIYKHLDQFLMMDVDAIEPSRVMKFEEVKGRIISLLQDQKEQKLLSALRSKYPVNINQDVLNTLKQEFEK